MPGYRKLRQIIFTISALFCLTGCISNHINSQASIVFKAYKQYIFLPTYPTYYVTDNLPQVASDLVSNNIGDDPQWSPDGNWIAFSTERYSKLFAERTSSIYILNIDESIQHEVVKGENYNPTWNPEGTKIAYDTGSKIWVLDVGCLIEGNENCLTEPNFLVDGSNPDWSPNGEEIAFETIEQHVAVITLNDESQVKDLTPHNQAFTPDWAPDGQRIVFSAMEETSHTLDILLYDYSNGKITNLTNGIGFNNRPRWMCDGESIVFVSSNRDGLGNIIGLDDTVRSSAIYTIGLETLDLTRIGSRNDEMILWYSLLP